MKRKQCELRQDEKKFTTVNPPRALSILRVSTMKQMNEGDGIENQRRHNNEYIKRRGYRKVKEIELAESASKEDRTGFEEAIAYTIAHKDEIDLWILYKVDRFSRGGVGAYFVIKRELARHDIRIEFSTQEIDETATGELLEGVLAAVASFENRLRTDRTIGVEKILTKEGYWCRAAPTGFVNGRDPKGKPILLPMPNSEQWSLLQYGLRKQMTGVFKIVEVAEELRQKGFKTRQGNPITPQTWTKIVRNPIYAGLICEKWTDGEYVRAKFNGAISPEEWKTLQEVLDGRTKAVMPAARKKRHADFPLRQFLLCPSCGERVRGSRSTGKMKKPYWYYHCKNKKCHFIVQTKPIHELFDKYMQKITPSPELITLFKEVVLGAFAERHQLICDGVTIADRELNAIREEKQTLVELMKQSADDPELLKDLKQQYADVRKRMSLAKLNRGKKEIEEVQAEVIVDYCVHFLEHAHKLWKESLPEEQFRLQSLIFPEGISYDVLTGKQTPKISPVYEAISELQNGDNTLAGPGRIELPLAD